MVEALLISEGTSSTEPRIDRPSSPVREELSVARSVMEELAVCMRETSKEVLLKSGDETHEEDSGVVKQ